jgi:ankyrin repeat protein
MKPEARPYTLLPHLALNQWCYFSCSMERTLSRDREERAALDCAVAGGHAGHAAVVEQWRGNLPSRYFKPVFTPCCKSSCACKAGNCTSIEHLVKYGADIYARDKDGKSGLHYATTSTSGALKFLVNNGVGIELPRHEGMTALHYAAINKKRVMVQYQCCLSTKATTLQSKSTPLHFPAENGSANSVTALLRYGAEINARDSSQITPYLEL